MVFVASFAIFIVFVGGLALGLLRNRPLKSEDEAKAAIMRWNSLCISPKFLWFCL